MTKKTAVVIGLTVVLGLVPIPYRQGKVYCKPCAVGMECNCPKEGEVGWRQPVFLQVWGMLTANTRLRSESIRISD